MHALALGYDFIFRYAVDSWCFMEFHDAIQCDEIRRVLVRDRVPFVVS